MAKLISKTYGDALFDIALEKAMTDSLFKEALALQKIFEENPELTAFLNHPNIEVSEKEKTVEAIFKAVSYTHLRAGCVYCTDRDGFEKIVNLSLIHI